jgi:hypothetical protein
MAQRNEALDSLDDFPTPPWATRALLEYGIDDKASLRGMSCLEPACGAGHMAKVLSGTFRTVASADIFDYRYGTVGDFLQTPLAENSFDWIITNPPFRLAEAFVMRSLIVARRGVAVLVRTAFIEGVGRYGRLYQKHPPFKFSQFTERVPMVKGRLDSKASTATSYGWLVWLTDCPVAHTRCEWIPPCRKLLELPGDYDNG